MNMWLKKNKAQQSELEEKVSYSRYYEHDGALRAYANRAMVLAFLCVPATLLALGFAVYVRVQPPTVIRVDENGQAGIVGSQKPSLSVTQGATAEPTEFEKRAFVRQFLERYLDFTPSNVSRNWADSLNMMTANLRRTGRPADLYHLRS
jgi:type IV secretory pathway TrbF-like protein